MKILAPITFVLEGSMRGWVLLVCLAAYLTNLGAPGLNLLAKTGCVLAAALLVWMACSSKLAFNRDALWSRVAKVLFALHVLVVLVWVALWSTPQIGDFGVYWRCGTLVPWSPEHWMQSCKTAYLDAVGVYGKRSFVYTLPIGLIFGSEPVALKIVNAALHIVTVWLAYYALMRQLGAKAACLGLLVLSLQPEWWYTLTIATPDNVAVPLILLSFVLIGRLLHTPSLIGAVGLGAVIVLLEWSRSLGPFVVIAFALAIAVNRAAWIRNGAQMLIALLAAYGINWGFGALNHFVASVDDPLKWMWAFDVSIRPPQNFQTWFDWSDHLWPAIDQQQRSSIGFARFLDEWIVQYQAWPAYMVEKSAILFKGTGTKYFVGVQWPDNVENVYTVAHNSVPVGKWSTRLSLALPLIVLPLVMAALFYAPLSPLGIAGLAFAAVFLALMIGFAEILSRYGVLMAPVMMVLAAHLGRNRTHVDKQSDRRVVYQAITGVAVLVSAFFIGQVLAGYAENRHTRLLMKMTQDSAVVIDGLECNPKQVPVWPYYGRRMRSVLPPDAECVSYHIPFEQAKGPLRSASLFVTRERLPFAHEKPEPLAFDYGFKLGDQPIQWFSLNDKAAAWHSFDLGSFGTSVPRLQWIVRRKQGQQELQFEVRDLLLRR